jgi:hypothetical protein
MNESEMVSISKEEYEQLLEASKMFNALMNAGVDNWDGFGYALEELEELEEDEDE